MPPTPPPGGSDGKESGCGFLENPQETWVWSLGWGDPLEKGTVMHSCILAWRIPWTEGPGRLVHGITKSRTRLSHFHSPSLPATPSQDGKLLSYESFHENFFWGKPPMFLFKPIWVPRTKKDECLHHFKMESKTNLPCLVLLLPWRISSHLFIHSLAVYWNLLWASHRIRS